MQIIDTPLQGAKLLQLAPNCDARGSFCRLFCAQGLSFTCVQMSLSTNCERGTLRGLHFQEEPYGEDKLIHCMRGRVFDTIVDIRPSSPTYGKHYSIILEPGKALFVPKGFAHGFLTLEDKSELLYSCSQYYYPESASGILWNDPALNIAWPFPPTLISDADQNRPTLEKYALSLL